MKRVVVFAISISFIISVMSFPIYAAVRTETIDIQRVEICCDVSESRIIHIVITPEQTQQIHKNLGENLKPGEKIPSIDLTGISGLNGFTLRISSWFSFELESMEDVKLFISPMAASSIEDFSGGEEVYLEMSYSFDDDRHVTGIDLNTTDKKGSAIKSVGVVSLPAAATHTASQFMTLERGGEIIAKSGVQDGLFYAAVSLTGSYTVVDAKPKEFEDEIPDWAKSSVDYLSARDVIQGASGCFRGNDGITRAEFLTMLTRLYNPESTELSTYYKFEDIADIPDWAIIGVHSMFMGVELDGFLYPNQVMTRGDILVTIRNYVLFSDLFYDPSNYEVSFSDKDSFTDEQTGAAWLMSRLGILEGFDDGSARLDEVATRAQAAVILQRYSQWETLNRTYR